MEVIREGFLEEVACAKKYRKLVRANRERTFSIGHGCANHGGEKGNVGKRKPLNGASWGRRTVGRLFIRKSSDQGDNRPLIRPSLKL